MSDNGRPVISDSTIAEAAAMEERDRLAGGPPWEVHDHPDHDLPGGWHRRLGTAWPDETERPELPSAEQCEQIFHAALKAHDMEGVVTALCILAVQDPHRASDLLEMLNLGLWLSDQRDSRPIPQP